MECFHETEQSTRDPNLVDLVFEIIDGAIYFVAYAQTGIHVDMWSRCCVYSVCIDEDRRPDLI